MISNKELKCLQQCELLIADEIKRICEKNRITYFMVAGTMLGAIRHNGFIPWDDDMDFGMLRKEYDRFVNVCKEELKPEFEIQTWDNDASYPFSFGKIRLKNTHITESFSSTTNVHDGIFVDVFPFDNVPDSIKERKKHARKYFFLKRALWIKKGYGKNIKSQSSRQKIKYIAFKTICTLYPYNLLKKMFDFTIRRYNQIETKRLIFDAPYTYEKNCIEKDLVKNLRMYMFNGHEYPGIENYDKYLKHLYGSYMELPEPEKRKSHDILSIEFGEFNNIRINKQ